MSSRIQKIFTALLQSEAAARLTQNELLMKGLLRAFSMSVELRHLIDQRVRSLVESLDVAKGAEVAELRAEIAELRARLDAAEPPRSERLH